MQDPSILVIHRRSTYTEMISDNGSSSMTGMLKRKEALVDNILQAHEAHNESMKKIEKVINERSLRTTWRHDLSGVDPDNFDMIITVGGDGTVLHASHSIGSTPLLAINSSPNTSVGYFTAGNADAFSGLLDDILDDKTEVTCLHRMEVKVNGEVINARVLNDVLFSHDCPASTTRYVITHGENSQEQISSGVWVSTAAGSTAAINAGGGKIMRPGSKRLQFVVREPGNSGGADNLCCAIITKGFCTPDESLSIVSKTSTAKLYIDGPHVERRVNFGDIITFSGAASALLLIRRINKNNS